jgi:hypothetical protein
MWFVESRNDYEETLKFKQRGRQNELEGNHQDSIEEGLS